MTINGSTSSSAWTYKLEATETATSTINRTSTIQVKAYIGRANSQSYLGGNYSVSVTCAGQTSTQNGNISYPTYINGGAWLELKTFTFTVSNTGNPTTISISSSFSSGDFTPSSASASGSMNLTILHLPPTISSIHLQELNTEVSNTGVLGYHVVQYLSRKKFTANVVYNDGASLSTFKIYHNNVLIGSSSTNEITIDFENVGILKTVKPGEYLMVPLVFEIKDNQNGIVTTTTAYRIVQYTPPSLEATSTTVKRKSGNGVNLVDNKATLNLVGVIYKNTIDGIGQNNAVTSAGYKIWEQNTSEPANYTPLTTTTDSSGNVTVSNVEISNVDFKKTYNYKIMFADSFKKANNQYHGDITTGTVPLGQPTWTEYKDRVDFLKLTINGNPVCDVSTCKMVTNFDAKDFYTNSEQLVTGWDTEFEIGDFSVDNTNNRLIVTNTSILEVTGNHCGNGNSWTRLKIYDTNNNEIASFQTLVQGTGNGFWNIPLQSGMCELQPTQTYYVQLTTTGYNGTFSMNSGFGSGQTWIAAKKIK